MRPIKGRLLPFGGMPVLLKLYLQYFFEILEKKGDIFTENFLNIWPH